MRAFEEEVNGILDAVHFDCQFQIEDNGGRIQWGCCLRGRFIPLETLYTYPRIVIIVALIAALLNRITRLRASTGLQTLRLVCLEADNLTRASLSRVLRVLSRLKHLGWLDQVLITHCCSVNNAGLLWGFKEHILNPQVSYGFERDSIKKDGRPVEEGTQ